MDFGKRIRELRKQSATSLRREPKMRNFLSSLQLLVANGRMSQDKATALIEAIEKKRLLPKQAFDLIQALVDERTLQQSMSH